ncbi:MAG: hypothetical protein QOF61_2355 [Acidobacteriota bacterium]|nr:hypothetical protein [Acidobacteriota bacterium]
MTNQRLPFAIYYEHPEWFRPLFAELERRGLPYVRLDAASHRYDPCETERGYSLLFNRMSASAYLRGHGNAIFYTRGFLAHVERAGLRVVNGTEAFAVETSKALQLNLLASLDLPFPRTRVINRAREAVEAARSLRFPVVVKPNIGGRGAGIVRYDSLEALTLAVETDRVELGIDSIALVQEFSPARGGHITRVETLGGKFLYAIKVYTSGESFNLCPAEFCQTEGDGVAESDDEASGVEANGVTALGEMCVADAPKSGLRVEAYEPPREIVAAVERIVAAARIDVGGVEYLTDERDGSVLFYDINALSNFVADAPAVVGFDPHARLVDYLEKEARSCVTATGSRFSAAG